MSATSNTAHEETEAPTSDETETEPAQRGDRTVERQDTDLSLDVIFEVLRNKRRRQALAYLKDNEGQATLSELAEHIAAIENDKTVQALNSSERKRVYVGLYQCHLPKMDDASVIEFDRDRGTVLLSSNADVLDDYIDDDTGERPWHWYYLSIAVAGTILFGIASLTGSIAGLAVTLFTAAIVGAFAACSLGHVYTKERDADA